MSLLSRSELTTSLRERYGQSGRAEKGKILDEYIAATGYHRKSAIRALGGKPARERRPPVRQVTYGADVRIVLEDLWRWGNRICGKRLIALLPDLVPALEKFGHLSMAPQVRAKVLGVSAATTDRLLRAVRNNGKRGKTATRRGSLLKSQIPLRTFTEWEDAKPGLVEADLVAHCGESLHGQFLNTLTLVDVATGWTECLSVLCKDQHLVLDGLKKGRTLMPFRLLGVDTDNGSEFLNAVWMKYCLDEQLDFTRSRPYRKNDQCFVEQKNGAVVRRMVGYDRYEGSGACEKLGALYGVLRLYQNYFQPSMKLSSKKREGAKVVRKYEPAETPYRRLLKSETLTDKEKERLRSEFERLDPLLLFRDIERKQKEFWELAVARVKRTEPAAATPDDSLQPEMRYYRRTGKATRYSEAARNRTWRTRADPFAEVWSEIEMELEMEPALKTKEILRRLQIRYPGGFPDRQLRTLQRRVRNWRMTRMKESVGVVVPDLDLLFVDHFQNQSEPRNAESNIFT